MGTTRWLMAVSIAAVATMAVGATEAADADRVAVSVAPAPSTAAQTPKPTASPTSPSPAPIVNDRVPAAGRVIYLTFDDGPDPRWTPEVLGVLRQYDARGTFFMIGQSAAQHPALIRQVRSAGHKVGDHSWSHQHLPKMTPDAMKAQMRRSTSAIGGEVKCVRPPYGDVNASVKQTIHASGRHVSLWDVDTLDWTKPGANSIANTAISGAHPGAVILMHDGGGERSQTVAALKTVLNTLSQRGYRFESLPTC